MRRHSTATLMGLTKKELVEYVRIAEHNQEVAEEALNQQAENVKGWMPVVHGHWFSLTDCSNAGVYCSVCNKKVWKEDYAWCNRKNKLRSNYCPNCGAKMDEEMKFIGICEHCVYCDECDWPKLHPKIKLKECPDFSEGDQK